MKTVNIIGLGNVGTHLAKALEHRAVVYAVNSRDFSGFRSDADFSIIAVSDNAIRKVLGNMPSSSSIIAHTSGTTSMDVLIRKRNRYGVFYPLQTFSKARELNYSEIPFFIEADSRETEIELCDLANLISDKVTIADSTKRRALHVASVFACNFANHLWAISDKILRKNGLDFATLRPLLKETLEKTTYMSPREAQTGPAIRKDTNTIALHLDFLSSDIEASEIYRMISSSIISDARSEKS